MTHHAVSIYGNHALTNRAYNPAEHGGQPGLRYDDEASLVSRLYHRSLPFSWATLLSISGPKEYVMSETFADELEVAQHVRGCVLVK
jgi:hypothetical protein